MSLSPAMLASSSSSTSTNRHSHQLLPSFMSTPQAPTPATQARPPLERNPSVYSLKSFYQQTGAGAAAPTSPTQSAAPYAPHYGAPPAQQQYTMPTQHYPFNGGMSFHEQQQQHQQQQLLQQQQQQYLQHQHQQHLLQQQQLVQQQQLKQLQQQQQQQQYHLPLKEERPSAAADQERHQTERLEERRRLTKEQKKVLEAVFELDPLPSAKTKRTLAGELGMSLRSVQMWFQNQRAKLRKREKESKDGGEISSPPSSGLSTTKGRRRDGGSLRSSDERGEPHESHSLSNSGGTGKRIVAPNSLVFHHMKAKTEADGVFQLVAEDP
jgi:hypothetical protein